MPATLPWPKMPKQPAKSFCSSPSDSEYCAPRKFTSACATVSRTFWAISRLLPHQSRVDALGLPGLPHPSMIGVIGDLPGALNAGSCHHVEVVHVETRSRHTWPVPAVRDKHRIPIVHLRQHLDRLARRGRRPHEAEARLTMRTGGDLEVVDLFQLRLGVRGLVVLVGRIGRPIA